MCALSSIADLHVAEAWVEMTTRISWAHTIEESKRDLAATGISARGSWSVISHALRSPGGRLLFLHRLQQCVGATNRFSAIVSSLIWNTGYVLSGCNIGRSAHIAGGVVFPHPVAIVIGNGARIESGCWIYQGVTIGATNNNGELGYPVLANDCQVFPGVCVFGPIKLAARTIVAANAVLLVESTDSGAMYAGIPAKKLKGASL